MENYTFIEKLGKGTHGTVYLLKSQEEDKLVVCKSITEKYKTHAFREISILDKLNHRRIISIYDSMVIKNSIHIILEYINYGSLESMIDFFIRCKTIPTFSLGWNLLAQMSDALYYLHSKKIIHRDIKPSNILISRFFIKEKEYLEFKLCDFSLSTRCESFIEDGHMVGTPFYMAPEIVERERYGHSVDVWGLGCCVYEVMTLNKPFKGEDRKKLFRNILEEKPEELIDWEDKGLEMLVRKCLAKENRVNSKTIAKHEKNRLYLAMHEIKVKENRIEELEKRLRNIENIK